MILLNDNFTTDTSSRYQRALSTDYYTNPLRWTKSELERVLTPPSTNPLPANSWLFDPAIENSLQIQMGRTGDGTVSIQTIALYELLDSNSNKIKGTEVDCSYTIKYPLHQYSIRIVDSVNNSRWIQTDEEGIKFATYFYYYQQTFGQYDYLYLNLNKGIFNHGYALNAQSGWAWYTRITDIDYQNNRFQVSHALTAPSGITIDSIFYNDYSSSLILGFYIAGKYIGLYLQNGRTFISWGDDRIYNEWENTSSWFPYERRYRAGIPGTLNYNKTFLTNISSYNLLKEITFRVIVNGDLIKTFINGELQCAFEANPRKQSTQYLFNDNVYLYLRPATNTNPSAHISYITNITVKDLRVSPIILEEISFKDNEIITNLNSSFVWKVEGARYTTEGCPILDEHLSLISPTLGEFCSKNAIKEFANLRLDNVNLVESDYNFNESLYSFIILNDSLAINPIDEKTTLPVGTSVSYISFDCINFLDEIIFTNCKIPLISKHYNNNLELIGSSGYSTEEASTSTQQKLPRSTQEKFSQNETTPLRNNLISLNETIITATNNLWNLDDLKTTTNEGSHGYGYRTLRLPATLNFDFGEVKTIAAIGFIGFRGATPLRFKWNFIYNNKLNYKSLEQYNDQSGEHTSLERILTWDRNDSSYRTGSVDIRDYYILPKTIKARYCELEIIENMAGLQSSSRSWYWYERNKYGRSDEIIIQKVYVFDSLKNSFYLGELSGDTINWQSTEDLFSQETLKDSTYFKFVLPQNKTLVTNNKYKLSIYTEGIQKC